jgi:hypothetical protein
LKTKALLASLLLFAWNSNSVERISFPVTDERPNILFLIADDWSFPHAGILGDALARTPTFDYLAANGALFTHAFCASPSCSPSRASILTGKYPHQLGAAANLWSVLPESHPNWMSILEQAGYHTGKGGKGWGPGNFEAGGYDHNPAGQNFDTFHDFLDKRKPLQPFAFWFGSSDPHRPYEANSGVKSGMDPGAVNVPGFLPDRAKVEGVEAGLVGRVLSQMVKAGNRAGLMAAHATRLIQPTEQCRWRANAARLSEVQRREVFGLEQSAKGSIGASRQATR